MRYIDASQAEKRIVKLYRNEKNYSADIFNTAIDACQTIILDMYDNSAIEYKNAEWVETNTYTMFEPDKNRQWYVAESKCSECGLWSTQLNEYGYITYDYCPRCGAAMNRGVTE